MRLKYKRGRNQIIPEACWPDSLEEGTLQSVRHLKSKIQMKND